MADTPANRPDRGPDVAEVTVDRERGELRLSFDDGASGAVPLAELRRHCPCATCRAARQAGHDPTPDRPTGVADAELVGAWGLGIAWDDGHRTGIYPFSSLHEWVVAGEPPFTPDSGLGA